MQAFLTLEVERDSASYQIALFQLASIRLFSTAQVQAFLATKVEQSRISYQRAVSLSYTFFLIVAYLLARVALVSAICLQRLLSLAIRILASVVRALASATLAAIQIVASLSRSLQRRLFSAIRIQASLVSTTKRQYSSVLKGLVVDRFLLQPTPTIYIEVSR